MQFRQLIKKKVTRTTKAIGRQKKTPPKIKNKTTVLLGIVGFVERHKETRFRIRIPVKENKQKSLHFKAYVDQPSSVIIWENLGLCRNTLSILAICRYSNVIGNV